MTWVPDGVSTGRRSRGRRRRLPFFQRPNVRFGMLMLFAGSVTAMMVDPAALPEPVRAMMQPEVILGLAETTGVAGVLGRIPGL